ncbi:MAG: amino acid permease [Candidatus Aminicenantes bacterium]|nr:amino acid permease [Candidatus Aminicenantes bacterium]
MENKTTDKSNQLVRQLGLFDSTMVMMGIVIGSGIFVTTGIMARSIPSAPLILMAWLVGGLLTFAGALTYAELGASMPEAGGQYVYLKEAYGPLPGFLFGWIFFLVYMTGGIAGLALAFSEYTGYLFPAVSTHNILLTFDVHLLHNSMTYSLSAGQLVGVGIIVFLSLCNFLGVGLGKGIQNLITVIKIGTIGLLITAGFAFGKASSFDLTLNPEAMSFSQIIIGFGVALVAVSWAFDGWNNVNFVAGEIKNPAKNLPLALFLGTLGVTLLYVLLNYIYLSALPIPEISGVVRIAEKATTALFGTSTGIFVSIAVVVSTFGSLNGSILTGPRVYYAMAKDRLFFKRTAQVHPKFRTPGFAIFIQAVWASFLTILGTFEQIFTFAMFVSIAFWVAGAASVFTLRKKYPDQKRPYKTWGYPVVPILFILFSMGILINTLIEKPVESMAGIILTLIGIPVYFYWKGKSKFEKGNKDHSLKET